MQVTDAVFSFNGYLTGLTPISERGISCAHSLGNEIINKKQHFTKQDHTDDRHVKNGTLNCVTR